MIKSLKFSKIINAIKLYYKVPQINVFLILALNEADVLSRTICIMMTKIKVLGKQNWLIWNLILIPEQFLTNEPEQGRTVLALFFNSGKRIK